MANVLPKLARSNDRKTACLVTPNGKQSSIKNAFGITAGAEHGSCVAQTTYCGLICYAGNSERIFPSVKRLVDRNFAALKDASYADMVAMLDTMITEFAGDCDRRNARRLFRIHWDGDFFSGIYVAAWSEIIKRHPDIQFWAYTRVPSAATFLHAQRHKNLGLYFSSDRDNVKVARVLQKQGLLIAHVENTFTESEARGIAGAVRCPENNNKLPLIDVKGSACARCGICVNGRKSVLFSATKS